MERKLGYISTDRMISHVEKFDEIPRLSETHLTHSVTFFAWLQNIKISMKSSTRKTTRPLELVHFDLPGKVDESPARFK